MEVITVFGQELRRTDPHGRSIRLLINHTCTYNIHVFIIAGLPARQILF